jgi:fluoride ion exporter CrcB/FEX
MSQAKHIGKVVIAMQEQARVAPDNQEPIRFRGDATYLITGGLGGFTTYSALATETVILAASHPGRAIGYAMGTVILGAAASVAGIWLSRRHLRPPMINTNGES